MVIASALFFMASEHVIETFSWGWIVTKIEIVEKSLSGKYWTPIERVQIMADTTKGWAKRIMNLLVQSGGVEVREIGDRTLYRSKQLNVMDYQ